MEKLANVKISVGEPEGLGVSNMVGTCKMFVALGGMVDAEEEVAKLKKDLEHQRTFLDSVRKKLSNEKFVAHAPENVVAVEKKKEADCLLRIEAIEASLKSYGK